MKKKLFRFALVLCLILGLTLAVAAEEDPYSGPCGENATWSFDPATGTLTLSGTGATYDFDRYTYKGWKDYQNQILHIVVEEGITVLGEDIFRFHETVESVTLPAGLEQIHTGAFVRCVALKSITIPGTVTVLEDNILGNCYALESVTLEEGIVEIGDEVFLNCSELASLNIPSTVRSIGRHFIQDCKKITTLELPEGLESMDGAFGWSSITHVTIPKGITALGDDTFRQCTNLTSLEIPEGVTLLGANCFDGCANLTELKIPAAVTSIGEHCFSSCSMLTQLELPEGISQIPNYAFSSSGLLTITIPQGVTSIGEGAFAYCQALERIYLPEGLESIGDDCFIDCINLNKITLPDSVSSIGRGCFIHTTIEEIVLPDQITELGSCAFSYCEKLVRIELPANLESIGDQCFENCDALVEVEIPVGVVSLGYGAFSYCDKLEKLTIPETVKYMEMSICECPNLTVFCKDNTMALLYCGSNQIPFEVLPETEELTTYTITGAHNGLGYVTLATFQLAPGRVGILQIIPYGGCYYYSGTVYDMDGNYLAELNYRGNDLYSFEMPAQDVYLEVLFDVADMRYVDVPWDAYYLPPVIWANAHGITTGTSYNTFSPDDPCTRGQVVTFLWRAAGCPEPESTENPFTDVSKDDYYYKAVLWAVENSITNGMTETTFAPAAPCTRAQVATFLWRAAGEETPTSDSHSFTDIQKDYYYDAVLWAVEWGITNGTSETTFSPDQTCNRAQIVTFLYRFLA